MQYPTDPDGQLGIFILIYPKSGIFRHSFGGQMLKSYFYNMKNTKRGPRPFWKWYLRRPIWNPSSHRAYHIFSETRLVLDCDPVRSFENNGPQIGQAPFVFIYLQML